MKVNQVLSVSVYIIAFALISCSVNREFSKQLPESLCIDIQTIQTMIENDKCVSKEFNFSSPDSIVFYSEQRIHAGFQPFLFFKLLEELVKQNRNLTREQAYLQLEKSNEKFEKIQALLPKGCIKNTACKDSADLLIQYWYNPADSSYSVEIEKILHQPGYSHGLVYQYVRTDSGFAKTNTSVWQE